MAEQLIHYSRKKVEISVPILHGREAIWTHETQARECSLCHEPIAPLFGHWLTLSPTQRFCSAACVKALDNYDGPREPDYDTPSVQEKYEQAWREKRALR